MKDIIQLIGHQIVHLDSVDSTNNYVAKSIDSGNLTEGSVIMANFQLNGKGRNRNSWQSNKNENLLMSFFIRPPHISAAVQFRIQKWVSSALCAWLNKKGIHAQIKLPNDIFVGPKKIAGILIENRWKGNGLKQSIVGIGVNLNQKIWDQEMNHKATSLILETNNQNEPLDCVQQLSSFLSHFYRMSIQYPKKMDDQFKKYLLSSCWITLSGIQKRKAQIFDIEDDGICTFSFEDGVHLKMHIDEITLHVSL